ncbi:MAG: YjiH family protein [Erysipelotrichaceae bacterium]
MTKSHFKFLIPSLLGVLLFMFPISQEGNITILVAIFSKNMQTALANVLPALLLLLTFISMVGGLIAYFVKPKKWLEHELFRTLFQVNASWLSLRVLAFLFSFMVFFETGFSQVYSMDTGGLVFHDLLPILFTIFLLAGLFLPLLLNFGLLEFVGALLIKVMRPVFNLPGRSAIDCITSWLGDGTIGVMLTSKQYESGFYTKREAAVIGTTFSLVSITFSLVVIQTVGLEHMFLPFYATVTIASLVAALIVPKLYPLNKKADVCIDGSARKNEEMIPKGTSAFQHGYQVALKRSHSESLVQNIVVDGAKNVVEMWIAVVPIVMAVGTLALLLATYTPLFEILGIPFLPILKLLQIPEAALASQTLAAGFADMLLPSILAAPIATDMTRFVIAAVSVSQLIYLSEVGALLLSSKIPVNFKDLILIFLERTLVTLPVIALIAHLLF